MMTTMLMDNNDVWMSIYIKDDSKDDKLSDNDYKNTI